LGVTQITAVQTYATADGKFEDGWRWVFNVTVPTDQMILQMKFDDWTNGSNIIPATDIRFYSGQSTNAFASTSAITITGAGIPSAPMYLNPNEDLDVNQGGRQIQITVEVAVPLNQAGGSYSTSYGIKATAPTAVSVTASNGTMSYGGNAPAITRLTAHSFPRLLRQPVQQRPQTPRR